MTQFSSFPSNTFIFLNYFWLIFIGNVGFWIHILPTGNDSKEYQEASVFWKYCLMTSSDIGSNRNFHFSRETNIFDKDGGFL